MTPATYEGNLRAAGFDAERIKQLGAAFAAGQRAARAGERCCACPEGLDADWSIYAAWRCGWERGVDS